MLKKIKADEKELLDAYNGYITNKKGLLLTTKSSIQKLFDELSVHLDTLNTIDSELISNKRFSKEENIINKVEDLECNINKLVDQAQKAMIPEQNELFKIFPNEVFLSKIQVLASVISGGITRTDSAPNGVLWIEQLYHDIQSGHR